MTRALLLTLLLSACVEPAPPQMNCTCACKPEGCYVAKFENAKCALWTNEHGQEQSCCMVRRDG